MNLVKNDSAEAVSKSLSFQRPSHLPVFDNFWDEFVDAWRLQYGLSPETDIEDYYWNDMTVIPTKEEFFPSQIKEIKRKGDSIYQNDGWGRIVRIKENAKFKETVEPMLGSKTNLDAVEFDPPDMDIRFKDIDNQVHYHKNKGRAVFFKIGGPYIRSSFIRGETQWLMDLAMDESFSAELAVKVGDHLTNVALAAMKHVGSCESGVWVFDDMCNIHAPMFSPRTFERIFLPIYKSMVARLKAAGAPLVFVHSDGNLTRLLDLLLEAGIDGINPVEPAAGMEACKLIDKYWGRLRFVGGICNSRIMNSGDPDAIRRHVEPLVDAGRNGGLVIGMHSVGPDISLAHYELYRNIVESRFAN